MRRETGPKANRRTTRDRAVMDQVVRYGMTTNEIVHKTLFSGRHPSAAAKVTARLVSQGYLERLPFLPPRVYFAPGARLAREYGLPAKRSYALGPQSLPSRYAVLAYAQLGRRRLMRLTSAEVAKLYPDFPSAWKTLVLCRDAHHDGNPTEIVRVDLGGAAHHVARKCERDMAGRMRCAAFRHRVAGGDFRLTILTTAQAKARAVALSIDDRAWPKGLAVHLAVIPDLYQLAQGDTHGT